jgi:hypothetical protein
VQIWEIRALSDGYGAAFLSGSAEQSAFREGRWCRDLDKIPEIHRSKRRKMNPVYKDLENRRDEIKKVWRSFSG